MTTRSPWKGARLARAGVLAFSAVSMLLLGDLNWYLPRWLEWLPRLDHDDPVEKPKPPKAPPAFEPTA